MSHECCSFCEQLPAIAQPGWAGSSSNCPVCKQDLWTAQNGTSYRIDTALMPVRRGMTLGWAGCVGVIAVGLVGAVWVNWTSNNGSERPRVSAPVVAPIAALSTAMPVYAEVEPAASLPPEVRAKPVRSEAAARAKTTSEGTPLADATRASVKAIPIVPDDEGPQVKSANRTVPAAWRWSYVNGVTELEAMLANVPQVDLDAEYLKKSKKQIDAFAKEIIAENKNEPDAFIKKLMKDRSDLSGMPFLLGKDCAINGELSRELAQGSQMIREALANSVQRTNQTQTKSARSVGIDAGPDAYRFWHTLTYNRNWKVTQAAKILPALRQIVLAEDRDFRAKFADHIGTMPGAVASEALANQAVFDLDGEVRYRAIIALRDRPKDEYCDVLLNALRHPWAPVVQNASQALATLELKEAVPRLVALLAEPAPNVPKLVPALNGEPKLIVREMVRVNHHRNCLLCHAPVKDLAEVTSSRLSTTVPIGPCPSGQEPLPPSSTTVYYSARQGVTLVRADVTYLRQDFSVRMKVADPGAWPVLQRFDFLVRTREVDAKELDARKIESDQDGYANAILAALRVLTGRDGPANADAWRTMLQAGKK